MSRVEIDRVVMSVVRAQPGTAQLYIGDDYIVHTIKQSRGGATQDYLNVELQIDDQKGGIHTYMICKRAPSEQKLPEALEIQIQNADTMGEKARLGLAKLIVSLGFYHKVYSLALTFSKGLKSELFEAAVYKMIREGVEHADLVQFGKRLSQSDAEILKIAVKVYALNGKVDFAQTLFEGQTNASVYTEIMRSALSGAGRTEEASAFKD
ncbi:MAG: hypothetical protein S4CHLAM2_17120 [Chlamydiales bacterium]|nr:hypothetical protein [Chlamydiales bacterium]